jgi:hypothetical protein
MTKCRISHNYGLTFEDLESLTEQPFIDCELDDGSGTTNCEIPTSNRSGKLKKMVLGAALIWVLTGTPCPSLVRAECRTGDIESLSDHVEATENELYLAEQELRSFPIPAVALTIDSEEIASEIEIITEYMSKMSRFYASRKNTFTV